MKDKEISEDEQKRSEAEVQKITDKEITVVDQLIQEKEQDILAV